MTQGNESSPAKAKRRHMRFAPEKGVYAQIDTRDPSLEFQFEFPALVAEYSPMGGCGLVILTNTMLNKGSICRVKIADLPALQGEVVWFKVLDEGIARCGIKFLE